MKAVVYTKYDSPDMIQKDGVKLKYKNNRDVEI